jgi:glutamine amidotransferase
MIAIVDYEAGNIKSVTNALERLGVEFTLTADPDAIRKADKVVLPGLEPVIRSLRQPVLGICVGMQLMCRRSEEGGVACMDIFDCEVKRFAPEPGIKVPHMGWNTLGNLSGKLFRGLPASPYVYFVHSYYAGLCPDTVATCRHGSTMFSAALKYENFYGTQFHPEKSGTIGETILKNFIAL